ncbi:MAG: TolC family outer membrane protein [Litoreibacter sp.]|nr:TolC family outer membrane protein [Litoreibacter sp.]
MTRFVICYSKLRRRSTALALGAFLAFAPTSSFADSLRQALAAAYENSNLLEQNRALLRATDEDVAVALSVLRPQISAVGRVTQADQASNFPGGSLTSSVELQMQLLIYDGGATKLAVEAAKETVLATRAQLLAQEQSVLLTAVNAYLGVLREQRTVNLRESNLRLITQELRAARDRFEVGEVTRTDVAQAEARLAEARGQLAQAVGNLAIAREQYRAAVGRSSGTLNGGLSFPKLPASLDAATARAVRMQPSIDQAQHQVKASELNAARAQKATSPQLSLSGSVGHNERTDNNSSVALQLSVPLYQGGQLRALERRALAQVHASRANLNQTVLIARQNVADSWSQLAVARAQLEANERQIRAAQVAFEGVREEAKLGARTTLDVLDAEQSLLNARTNGVVFETQVFSAAYQLLFAMGDLTVTGLGLPVAQYDPAEYFNAVKSAPIKRSKQGAKLDRILKRYEN